MVQFSHTNIDMYNQIAILIIYSCDVWQVPFIAFYRKEYVEPELNINDLWKIYRWDEKWMQLRNRRQAMVSLFEKMQVYQFEQIEPDKPLPSDIRTLSEEDLDR